MCMLAASAAACMHAFILTKHFPALFCLKADTYT